MKPAVRKALGAKETPGMKNLQPDPQNVYTPEKGGEQRFSHPTTLSQFSLRPRTTQMEEQQLFDSGNQISGLQSMANIWNKSRREPRYCKEQAPRRV